MNIMIGTHLKLNEDEELYQLIESLPKNIECFQTYLGPKVGGKTRVLKDEDVEKSVKVIGKRGFYIHSCLTNTLSCDKKYKGYCKKRIVNELRHVKKFPLAGVVLHIGTRNLDKKTRDLEETLDIIVKNIVDLYNYDKGDLGCLFIENCAGEGSKVPRFLDEISYIIKRLEELKMNKKVKICIDTCHLFAAGEFDISKSKEIIRFKKDFSEKIGLKYLKLIHLNDSKDKFGSRKDRHEIIGEGYIWKNKESLRTFFKSFPKIPYVCETSDYKKSLAYIKSL